MIEGSSVGQYTHEKNDNHFKTISTYAKNSVVDSVSSHELGVGFDSLSCRIPNINDLISPIIDAAHQQQSQKGTVSLKTIEGAQSGVWQSSICINAKHSNYCP